MVFICTHEDGHDGASAHQARSAEKTASILIAFTNALLRGAMLTCKNVNAANGNTQMRSRTKKELEIVKRKVRNGRPEFCPQTKHVRSHVSEPDSGPGQNDPISNVIIAQSTMMTFQMGT